MKMLCKLFGHKWTYAFLPDTPEKTKPSVRFCHKCLSIQYRKYHMGSKIWSHAIRYTELGAMTNVEGYGEK